MTRKLATIRQILSLDPIPGADAIEVATVDGWKVVVKKGEFSVGDEAVYCEIDSFLPIRPEFEFLRKSSYRKLPDNTEGFRLKTVKLRGQLSQGLLLPVSILPSGPPVELGTEVTGDLEITKWEPPIPTELAGAVLGPFPSRIPKTDEERIQNLPELLGTEKCFTVTEKLDGASATFFWDSGEFGVCSRNWNLAESATQSLWRWARENKLADKLAQRGQNIAVQGEFIGPGVQGNSYRLTKTDVRLFNAFDIDRQIHLSPAQLQELAETLGLATVPILERNVSLQQFESMDAILKHAEGPSVLNPKTEREGLVFRCEGDGEKISFKAISNRFLLAGGA